jgi:hypothetical protein
METEGNQTGKRLNYIFVKTVGGDNIIGTVDEQKAHEGSVVIKHPLLLKSVIDSMSMTNMVMVCPFIPFDVESDVSIGMSHILTITKPNQYMIDTYKRNLKTITDEYSDIFNTYKAHQAYLEEEYKKTLN